MSTLDWSFVALASGVLLFTFFGVILLFSWVKNKKKARMLRKRRPPKNKKKRKRFIISRRKLESKVKKQLIGSIMLFLFAGIFSAGAMYSRYYQQNKLNGKESEAIVQGYYLIDELSVQLDHLQKNENPQKTSKNISNLSSKLVSFGFTKASEMLKEDKQVLLNRHFNAMKQLGTNLHDQSLDTLQKEEVLTGYINDVKKLETSQKQIFKEFKINEDALKKKQ